MYLSALSVKLLLTGGATNSLLRALQALAASLMYMYVITIKTSLNRLLQMVDVNKPLHYKMHLWIIKTNLLTHKCSRVMDQNSTKDIIPCLVVICRYWMSTLWDCSDSAIFAIRPSPWTTKKAWLWALWIRVISLGHVYLQNRPPPPLPLRKWTNYTSNLLVRCIEFRLHYIL